MSGIWDSSLSAPLVAALETLGFAAGDAVIRETAVPAARGTNLVLAYPPAARYAVPALAGLLGTVKPEGRVLALVPGHALEEWAAALAPLAGATALSLLTASGPARAARRIRDDKLQILLTTPAVASELQKRSALKPDQVSHVVLGWPEQFEDAEVLAGLLQDLDKDAQRLVHLSQIAPPREVVDRYARRAIVTGPLASPSSPAAAPSVQFLVTPWQHRGTALRAVLETLDPAGAVVWAADLGSASDASSMLSPGDQCTVATGDATATPLVIAYDLPDPPRLAQLCSAGSVVLLVPPHADPYVQKVTAAPRPLRVRGAADAAESLVAARRARITATCDGVGQSGALLALAPLFDRHDPAQIAAALYTLWTTEIPLEKPAAALTVPATARVWVGTGKKDEVTPNDLVAALTRELRVDRTRIGKIDVRELYCLVEVPAEEAEDIARRLNGTTIRRRRVTARVDRGVGPQPRGKSVRSEK